VVLLFFFLFGCYALIANKQCIKNIPVFYSFVFWILLSYMPLHWERWGLPMYVSPLLISAIGIGTVMEKIKTDKRFLRRQKLWLGVFFSVICVAALNLIISSYASMMFFTLPDSRTASQEYAAEHGITRENSVFEGYTVLHPTGPGTVFNGFEEIEGVFYLRDRNIEHVLLSSAMYDRFKAEPERYEGQISFYNSLAENFTETKRFETISRNSSVLDIPNVFHSINYIIRVKNHGTVGFTLIFYEAAEGNYIPIER